MPELKALVADRGWKLTRGTRANQASLLALALAKREEARRAAAAAQGRPDDPTTDDGEQECWRHRDSDYGTVGCAPASEESGTEQQAQQPSGRAGVLARDAGPKATASSTATTRMSTTTSQPAAAAMTTVERRRRSQQISLSTRAAVVAATMMMMSDTNVYVYNMYVCRMAGPDAPLDPNVERTECRSTRCSMECSRLHLVRDRVAACSPAMSPLAV